MGAIVSIDGADGSGKTTFLDALVAHFPDKKFINADEETYPLWKALYTDEMSANEKALFYYALMKRKYDLFEKYSAVDELLVVERYGYTSLAFNRAAVKQSAQGLPPVTQDEMDAFMLKAAQDLPDIVSGKKTFKDYLEENFSDLSKRDALTRDYYTGSKVLGQPDHYVFLFASDETILERVASRKRNIDLHEKKEFLLPYSHNLKELYNENADRVVFIDTDKVAAKEMVNYALQQRDLTSRLRSS